MNTATKVAYTKLYISMVADRLPEFISPAMEFWNSRGPSLTLDSGRRVLNLIENLVVKEHMEVLLNMLLNTDNKHCNTQEIYIKHIDSEDHHRNTLAAWNECPTSTKTRRTETM